MIIKIELPYPQSVNKMYARSRSGQVRLSEMATEYKTQVGWLCRAVDMQPLEGNLRLHIEFYRPRKSGDIDNPLKLLLDSLIGHAYNDDSQVKEMRVAQIDDYLVKGYVKLRIEPLAEAGQNIAVYIDGRLYSAGVATLGSDGRLSWQYDGATYVIIS